MLQVLFQQRIEQVSGNSEIGLPEPVHGLHELCHAPLRRQIENSQSARHTKAYSFSGADAFAIIHQQQVRMEGDGQLNSGFFARIDAFQRAVFRLAEGG